MKRIITIMMVCLLLTAMVLGGCRNNQTNETNGGADVDTTGASVETTKSALEDSIFDTEATKGTDPVEGTDPTAESTKPSEPEATTEPAGTTEPTQSSGSENVTEPSQGEGSTLADEYERFMAMSGKEQQAFQESFGEGEAGLEAFFEWRNAAKEAYEQEHPPIEIGGDGVIDMDDLFGGQ